jgi:hypothetical protein
MLSVQQVGEAAELPSAFARMSPGAAQKFLSTHADVFNTFNVQRPLASARTHRTFRAAAMSTWRGGRSCLKLHELWPLLALSSTT